MKTCRSAVRRQRRAWLPRPGPDANRIGLPWRSPDGLPRDMCSLPAALPTREGDAFSAVIKTPEPGAYRRMTGTILQPLAELLRLAPDEVHPFCLGVRRDIGQLAAVGNGFCRDVL